MNYDLLNQEKVKEEPCPICKGTGLYGDNVAGIKGNIECECDMNKPMLDETTRKVSDLTIAEAFEFMIKAVKECKRRDAEEAKVAYKEKWPNKILTENEYDDKQGSNIC